MRKIALFFVAATFVCTATAQDASREAQAVANRTVKNEGGSTKGAWTKGGAFSLNVNQGGFDNWIPAGDADWSIGLNGYVNLFANKAWYGKRVGKAKAWTNNLDIFQAIQNVHDERTDANTFNKLDDRIDFLSRYSVELKSTLSFATIANVRTQLYDTRNGLKQRKNGFFAPAIVTLAPGFEWKPTPWFNAFISPFSNRWVIVSNNPYSIAATELAERKISNPASVDGLTAADMRPFGVDPGRMVDWQPGAFAQFNLNKDLDKAKKINWRSRLDLYSNYARRPDNIDIFFDNILSMKVNKWISANISLTMIYDDDVKQFGWGRDKAGLQYRHNIGIGVTRRF